MTFIHWYPSFWPLLLKVESGGRGGGVGKIHFLGSPAFTMEPALGTGHDWHWYLHSREPGYHKRGEISFQFCWEWHIDKVLRPSYVWQHSAVHPVVVFSNPTRMHEGMDLLHMHLSTRALKKSRYQMSQRKTTGPHCQNQRQNSEQLHFWYNDQHHPVAAKQGDLAA